MQTRALRTLLEVDRVGSFAAAASNLNMTLSAVSMQMKSLEAELGVDLFDRRHRPPKMTPMGKAVAQASARVVGAEADLVALCRPTDRLTGRFRVGFVPTASIRLLPGFLKRSQTIVPDATFEIETGLSEALEDRIRSGALDCAVVTATTSPAPRIHYHVLRTERLVYVAPVAARAQTLSGLFADLPFFHFLPDSGIGKLIATHVQTGDRRPARSVYLDSVEAIMECVNAGLGFTLLPEPDIRRHLGDTSIVVETEARAPARQLVLAVDHKGPVFAQSRSLPRCFLPNTLPTRLVA